MTRTRKEEGGKAKLRARVTERNTRFKSSVSNESFLESGGVENKSIENAKTTKPLSDKEDMKSKAEHLKRRCSSAMEPIDVDHKRENNSNDSENLCLEHNATQSLPLKSSSPEVWSRGQIKDTSIIKNLCKNKEGAGSKPQNGLNRKDTLSSSYSKPSQKKKAHQDSINKYNPLHNKRIQFIFASRKRQIDKETSTLEGSRYESPIHPFEMEYLIKFEKTSYRHLEWIPQHCFPRCKGDPAYLKLANFHRRMCENDAIREVPLTSQQEGNFALFQIIDRIIAVRLKTQEKSSDKSLTDKAYMASSNEGKEYQSPLSSPSIPQEQEQTSNSLARGKNKQRKERNVMQRTEKEYLVKWEHLGYAESTWESESTLKSQEDLHQVELFNQRNSSFIFPSFQPGSVQITRTSDAVIRTFIDSEDYETPLPTETKENCQLWETFLRDKLCRDGTYKPSLSETKFPNSISAPVESAKLQPRVEKRLMKHQQEGIRWIFYNTEVACHGSLLADEMGLGKTCQTITALEHYLHLLSDLHSIVPHALVVVQKTLVDNWRREFQAWTPHLNVYPLCGRRSDRQIARLYEETWMCYETGKELHFAPPTFDARPKKLIKPDVVLVTYESVRSREFHLLMKRLTNAAKRYIPTSQFEWACIVVDECQKLKGGQESILLQSLYQLNYRLMILLTGTPVQNSTKELFPLLALLDPQVFQYQLSKHEKNPTKPVWSVSQFNDYFSNLQERSDCMQRTEELHQLIAPYILRREKSHVLKTLASKTIQVVRIPLTLIQKRVYSALYHKSLSMKGLKMSNIHMQLRKCCIHPFLIEGVEELIVSGKISSALHESGADDPTPGSDVTQTECLSLQENPTTELRETDPNQTSKTLFLESSGKFILLKKMIEFYYASKRKILLFSYFKSALDLIEDFLALYDYPWFIERVDGQTLGEQRQLMIDRFNTDERRFLFLCTTRAGGLGINLSAASVVIHFDSDFNPQHDLQAQARCHRIGQDKSVDVFHFIAQHTYEDYMLFSIAGKKLGLEAVLLGRLNASQGKIRLDKQQEESVLRKGVYAAIRDDDSSRREVSEFAKLSIEEILRMKSTHIPLKTQTSGANIPSDSCEHGNPISPSTLATDQASSNVFFPFLSQVSQEQFFQQPPLPDDLDETQPDFWVQVARHLKPLTLKDDFGEQQPKELRREDRRRNRFHMSRVVDFNSSHETGGSQDSQRYSLESQDLTTSQKNMSDDTFKAPCVTDDSKSETSNSSSEKVDDTLNGLDDLVQDLRYTRKAKTFKKQLGDCDKPSLQRQCQKVNSRTKKETPGKIDPFQQIWKDHSLPVACLGCPANTTATMSADSSSLEKSKDISPPCLHHQDHDDVDVLDFVYRCLKCLQRWKLTPKGKSGTCKVEDLRNVDRCSPWSLPFHSTQPEPLDSDLLQSWKAIIQEWSAARNEWEKLKSRIIETYSKSVWKNELKAPTQPLAQQEDQPVPSTCLVSDSSTQNLNQFLPLESQEILGDTFRKQILTSLKSYCDEIAHKTITGKQGLHTRKQTWIFSEDFCIKLMFVHFMSKLYPTDEPILHQGARKFMRWGHSQTAINWTLATDVLRKLNQYTGGPERYHAAIQYRFYNKLDSRWNHQELTAKERGILAVAIMNRAPAHLVAQDMLPGRTLERVRHELRCCQVSKKNHAKPKTPQPWAYGEANCSPLSSLYLSPQKTLQQETLQNELPHEPQRLYINTPTILHDTTLKQAFQITKPYLFNTVDCCHKVQILQRLQKCLFFFGISSSAFRKLFKPLQAQPIEKLTKLLHQLQCLCQHHKETRKITNGGAQVKNESVSSTPNEHKIVPPETNPSVSKSVSLTEAALELSASLQAIPVEASCDLKKEPTSYQLRHIATRVKAGPNMTSELLQSIQKNLASTNSSLNNSNLENSAFFKRESPRGSSHILSIIQPTEPFSSHRFVSSPEPEENVESSTNPFQEAALEQYSNS